jgi:hypothetical protein
VQRDDDCAADRKQRRVRDAEHGRAGAVAGGQGREVLLARIGQDVERTFDFHVEAAARAGDRAARAQHLQHRARRDRATIEDCAFGDQAEAVRSLAGVIGGDHAVELVCPGWDVHRPVVGNCGVDRRLEGVAIVMAVVADCAVALYVDPGSPRTHQDIAVEGRRAGRRQRRKVARRLRQRAPGNQPPRDQRRRRQRTVDPCRRQHQGHHRRAAKTWPVVAP